MAVSRKVKTHFPVFFVARKSYCKYGTIAQNLEVRQVSFYIHNLYDGMNIPLCNIDH